MSRVRIPPEFEPLMVDITTISQHPRNYRGGDVDKITASIEVNGFLAPILVQRSTGHIVYGNHRYVAMLALGETHIPAHVVDLTDEQAHRYLVADNLTSDSAVNDLGMLTELLEEMKDTEMGLAGSGVDEDEYQRMLEELAQPPEIDGEGFATDSMGIFQVVIDFTDRDDMHALATELQGRDDLTGTVREVSL